MRKVALVSSCMIGIPCQYSGRSAKSCLSKATIKKLDYTLIPVCPEQLGGLPTPRPPAEIMGGDGFDVIKGNAKVVTHDGQDVTEQYVRGAEQVLRIAQMSGASLMIVKRKSPSCSRSRIYDGTFSRRLIDGVGVTSALLMLKTNLELLDSDTLDSRGGDTTGSEGLSSIPANDRFDRVFTDIFRIYQSPMSWSERQKESVKRLQQFSPWQQDKNLETQVQNEFRQRLPDLCKGASDSDTIRFFRDAFRHALNIDVTDPNRHCRICTYPEGFLDSHLNENGICSACQMYEKNKSVLEDKETLRRLLGQRLEEAKERSEYGAIVALSGGKDSVYMLTRLTSFYDTKVLCVMDDLNQQTDQAMRNARNAVEMTKSAFQLMEPPLLEREIRKNFLRAGESFCKLCLRSHFVRVYQAAITHRIPFVFIGLSPYQCLDCSNAIEWSLGSIEQISTPLEDINYQSVVAFNKHRAFQGGFDRGFVKDDEQHLLQTWINVFDKEALDFAPLVVPFFIFDGYPNEEVLIETIRKEVNWEPPEKMLLHRTNCKWLRPAGILHRAVGKHHLNYKERATYLRFQGEILSEEDARKLYYEIDTPDNEETMTLSEFEDFLRNDFDFDLKDIPDPVRTNLYDILKK
jgi:uncharacterized protein YbbK (DUF523 family)